MKLIVVGAGAFGQKHLASLSTIDNAKVISVVGPNAAQTKKLSAEFGIPNTDAELADALKRPGVEGAILATPTHLHASQAMECLSSGVNVSVEIPAADNWSDAEALAKLQEETELVCMVGHTRRYNPSHQWIKRKIDAGEFSIQHLNVQTFFFRRTNTNALGEPRDWTDHLLWHHAAHTVDLFQYQTGETIKKFNILQGPVDPKLGIALDMSIQMQSSSGKILTLGLSFNNDGPLGTFFRYIGSTGTYIARYDELVTGHGDKVDLSNLDVSMNGIELQNRDFITSIQKQTEPIASIRNVLPCYEVLNNLNTVLNQS